MTNVTASIECKIYLNDKSFLLDSKKYHLIENILSAGSITQAAKFSDISYRTALNYIDKIEKSLNTKLIITNRGGKGGGGATLTKEGYSILKECKKIDSMRFLHKRVNEIEAFVYSMHEEERLMTLKCKDFKINIPLNKDYKVGQKVLALINYDTILIMLVPFKSSVRNILKGRIIELKLLDEIVRVKAKVGSTRLCCLTTVATLKDLDLRIGKEVYFGFKSISVATLKL